MNGTQPEVGNGNSAFNDAKDSRENADFVSGMRRAKAEAEAMTASQAAANSAKDCPEAGFTYGNPGLRMNAYERAKAEAMAQIGILGQTGADMPPGLRSRIALQRMQAEIAAERANTLRKLEYLLDKNPEVAQILDLLEKLDA